MPEFNLLHVNKGGQVSTNSKCNNCGLCDSPRLQTNCMSGTGRAGSTFIFAGHGPSIDDDSSGAPFLGGSGRFLRTLLGEASFPESSIFFTNALKCATFNEKPKDSHWKKCKGHFAKELEEIKPKAIAAFGPSAFKWLTGFGGANKFRRRGFPCILDPSVTVYPFEQLSNIRELDGEDYQIARTKLVGDLMWLKEKGLQGNLSLNDNVVLDYKRAKTVQDVLDFLAEFPEDTVVYADLECADEENNGSFFPYPGHKIVAAGFSNGPGHARTIPYKARGILNLTYWTEEELEIISTALKKFWLTHKFIGHNLIQFDQKWITAEWGIGDIEIPFEPQLASHLLNEEPGNHDLQTLALQYSQMLPWKSEFTVKDILRCCDYLAKDVDAGSRMWPKLMSKMNPKQLWLHENLQIPLAYESRRMEQRGIGIDTEAVDKVGEALDIQMEAAEKIIRKCPEVQAWELKNRETFNIDSNQQVGDLMENYLKLPCIKRTESGQYSVDVEVKEFYEEDSEFVKALTLRGRSAKLKRTYVEGVREMVRLHGPVFNYGIRWHGTVTGRPAGGLLFTIPRVDTAKKSGIEDPSLIKSMFVPVKRGRILMQADYSQAELRVLASFSGDAALKKAYEDGVDAHTSTAARVYGVPLEKVTKSQRSAAKSINFGIVYGKSEKGMEDAFVIAARETEKKTARAEGRPMNFTKAMEESAKEAGQNALKAHKEAHPGIWRYLAKQEYLAKNQKFIETPFGRRRHFKTTDNRAIRQAFNFQIQSVGSGDITHEAIVRCARILRALNLDAYPVLTVYDSVVFSVTPENLWEVADVVKQVMENMDFDWLDVPLVVDFEAGHSWGRLRELDLVTRTVVTK